MKILLYCKYYKKPMSKMWPNDSVVKEIFTDHSYDEWNSRGPYLSINLDKLF